jgi:hypothetical protein
VDAQHRLLLNILDRHEAHVFPTDSRLEPFKRLANTLKERLPGVVRGMLDGRSNAYVEAMNGLLQQTKPAARGFRTVINFIAIAYLRMAKLKHLPTNPLLATMPLAKGVIRHAA